ncbi:type IV secretory pathway TrbL component [Nonomuraea thailandensis]|uniref:Type IV secretory pathway TrbL component n=1 Tax=Nonomuraea thailandensis TaxID=1188745 RepID=A0A9X2GFU9_9ACTN|nr:hypothetical protein [Nonomuraea thailandensis]MCP2357060.1 type IV secretory pathway TrbL component [Nonomuraea thailandensis]
MKLTSCLMVIVAVGATVAVTPSAAHADHYTTYKNSSARGGTLYLQAAMGARSGGRTTIGGSLFRLYANTYNGADGGLHATANSVSGVVVLSHPRYNSGRSGCKWVLGGSTAGKTLTCESRIAG